VTSATGTWGQFRFNPRTDLKWRWNEIELGIGSARTGEGHGRRAVIPGSVRAVALAMIRLQENRYGVVVASAKKIAAKAGIGESTFWDVVRPALEGVGFMITVERGGGRKPGGDGRANVYMAPEAGQEPAEVKPAAPYRLELNEESRASWRPLPDASDGEGVGREPPHT
jgi:hypothetical protein